MDTTCNCQISNIFVDFLHISEIISSTDHGHSAQKRKGIAFITLEKRTYVYMSHLSGLETTELSITDGIYTINNRIMKQ